jgi:NMD protein affecting ribosome stability and mRNA decay
MLRVRAGLETNFGNEDLAFYRVGKIIEAKVIKQHNGKCARSGLPLAVHAAQFCPSCGRGFSSSDMLVQTTSLLQIGREDSSRVCAECADMQAVLHWTKCANFVHTEYLHQV